MDSEVQQQPLPEVPKAYGGHPLSRWQLALKVTISLGILGLLIVIVDWAEFARILGSSNPKFMLLAGVVLALGNLSIALRWQLLLVPVGVRTTFLQAYKSYLKGHFIAFFMPSAVTADVVKAVDMNHSRIRGTQSRGFELASSIFIERAFGAITVGMAVVLGLTLSPLVAQHAGMQQTMTLSAVAVVICCVVALFADQLLHLIPEAALDRWPPIRNGVARVRTSFEAYRSDPGRLLLVMLLSIIIQALRIVPVYMIALAIGVGDRFFPFLVAVPIVFLVNMVPVLGSRVGTEQGMFVLLLGLTGIRAESALVIALASLVLGIIAALPGAYWLMSPISRRPSTAPE